MPLVLVAGVEFVAGFLASLFVGAMPASQLELDRAAAAAPGMREERA